MDKKRLWVTGSLIVLFFVFGVARTYAGGAVKGAFIDSLYNGVLYFMVGAVLSSLLVLAGSQVGKGVFSQGFGGIGKNIFNVTAAIVLGALLVLLRYAIVFRMHFLMDTGMPLDLLALTLAARTLEIVLLAVFVVGVILPMLLEHWGMWVSIAVASLLYAVLQLGQLAASRGFLLEKILGLDVALALSTAVLMYAMLCYAFVRTRRLWFSVAFVSSWSAADYLVFKVLGPDISFYDSRLDAVLVVMLLSAGFFICAQIVKGKANAGVERKDDGRFRPKHNWVK